MAEGKVSMELKSSPKKHNNGDAECDWGVELMHAGLADIAYSTFNQGINKHPRHFKECLMLLTQHLSEAKPNDVKVRLNTAIVKYYQSGLKDNDSFQKSLKDICTQAGIQLDQIAPNEEIDASSIRLNYCITLFHLKQYNSAVILLEEIYKGLESLEENVGIGLCLLLIECLLSLSQPGRALAVVAHTEAIFLPQPLPPQPGSKMHTDNTSRSPDKVSGRDDAESPLNRNIMSSHTSNDPIGGNSELRCSANQEILRGRLFLLRLRCLLMMRTLKMAKKEVKVVITHAINSGNQLNVTLLMIKSLLEYLKGGHKKAMKILNQCASIPAPPLSFGPKLPVAYYNNLGVIHLGLGKPTLACFYLQKAMNELRDTGKKRIKEEERYVLYGNGNVVDMELCYNLGITLLHMNKPSEAFDFLIEVVKIHSTNPKLWLRLAECCIAQHKIEIDKCIGLNTIRSSMVPLGEGTHQKISLEQRSISHDRKMEDQQQITDAALPVPTLEFARLCLRNALVLIPENISTAVTTEEQELSGLIPELYPCLPSPPLKGHQMLSLKLTCLMCSAYVSLCLGEYFLALRHAQSLLAHVSKNEIGGIYKLHGHLYAGESLIYLGRIPEAVTHFDPRLVGDLNIGNKDENSGLQPIHTSLDDVSAKKLLFYNLCVAYCLKGQFDKASSLLNGIVPLKNSDIPPHVLMLVLYVHLQLGNTGTAQNMIKALV